MRGYRVVFLALLCGAVCAACGGDDKAAAPASSTSSTTTASSEPASASSSDEPGFEVSAIAAGDQHVCALDIDGVAYCWGYNRMGQLGDGTNDDSSTPVEVATDQRFTSISAGRYFSCVLTAVGETFCWGDNSSGQLGNGATGGGGSTENKNTLRCRCSAGSPSRRS